MNVAESVGERFELLGWALDERLRRLLAAAEAQVLGRGGVTTVAKATGVSRRAIHAGLKELAERTGPLLPVSGRVRRPGAGRKRLIDRDLTLRADLERLVESVTRGAPETPLRWTCKSLRRLAEELGNEGHRVSRTVVGQLLYEMGYSLQANAKTLEGTHHPDRNTQFEHINREVQARLAQRQPVIFSGHEEKRADRGLQEPGADLASKGSTGRSQRL
jgi:DDE family transposase